MRTVSYTHLDVYKRQMVESADVVVAYVLHDWGGAATTLRCAKQKKKQIISYRDEMGS